MDKIIATNSNYLVNDNKKMKSGYQNEFSVVFDLHFWGILRIISL